MGGARAQIATLAKKLQTFEDPDEADDAESLVNRIDNKRADVLNKYRSNALNKYIDDSKRYWAKKEKNDKRHLEKLRDSHERKRAIYEESMSQEKQNFNDMTQQIRAESSHQRNKLYSDYNRRLQKIHNKERMLHEFAQVEKKENTKLEERLSVIAHEAARVKKDFHAYEEMSSERNNKTMEVRRKTDAMRNLTYTRLVLKERDCKKLNNKSKQMIKNLTIDLENQTNYTLNRTMWWEGKVKEASKMERERKFVSENKHKAEMQTKIAEDKKKYDEEEKKRQEADKKSREDRKKELDEQLKKYESNKKKEEEGIKKQKDDLSDARKKEEEENKKKTEDGMAKIKKDEEDKKKKDDETIKKKEEEDKKAKEEKDKQAKEYEEEEERTWWAAQKIWK